ncbi:indolepyruvate ferredoxin oxidoreductase subunit alpha [Pseudomaricurvus alkylphenolicus]|jgi:indolepyruvate ferredoxin oxidoreductase alpha subunit|uniref:indolepyruvate ferredoxin oxidoreductase subunit alpha n=1 Tax=Pseudomaricurvus alkylphenolicus TaxID=1306991 RepID=UPI0014207524|nr:indolepyruvate ferredoxin oxidoreductase subunit alpha [Pseudomaricurvus alkylphenolicus]NIB40399.1 indolepyruvate ferredoxin oxidoreductase subunit alpha [Pseudomaricurvus alkylphenolicus]
MAERSFKKEVQLLRKGAGEELHVEGILGVTKALLQAGVAYVGGYQGSPISHLMDVLNDAQDILGELDVHFESNGSEATAAAMLAASVNYPLRGAVAWKSTVGTNVASDALANLASGGVQGGALVVVGEDYGEGSSIMQERSHAFAMKSQMWLLDPRPNLPMITEMVEQGFELSEASNTPVMLELRIRACHVHGTFTAKDNQRPRMTVREAKANPNRDYSRIVLPPSNFLHEKEKIEGRLPAAIEYIKSTRLNEFMPGDTDEVGLILQGGLYNTVIRALNILGLADSFGNSRLPMYVMNVTYPYVDEEIIEFCAGKKAVLMIEEGQPEYIEQAVAHILRKADLQTRLYGKDVLPSYGEYQGAVVMEGVKKFLHAALPQLLGDENAEDSVAFFEPKPVSLEEDTKAEKAQLIPVKQLEGEIPPRPSGFCVGCPERPIFSAMKQVQQETGEVHVSSDIGCHLFSILPPFNLGATTMGYGLGAASGSAFNVDSDRPSISVMGDGGFWHNGLTSGISNAVFNKSNDIVVIVDNNYAAATGGQDILSSKGELENRSTQHAIEHAVKGVGVEWVQTIDTYDVGSMKDTLKEAMNTPVDGPKVIIAQNECMLNKQRREKPAFKKKVKAGKRVVRERFFVDSDTCTGDHACIRLSGCPSLTVKDNPNPLKSDPVAYVDNDCLGCGLCGANAHTAVLCPSFSRTEIVFNPSIVDRLLGGLRRSVIGFLQNRIDRRLKKYAF